MKRLAAFRAATCCVSIRRTGSSGKSITSFLMISRPQRERTVIRAISILTLLCISAASHASLDSKTWPASDEAQQFVKDTVVIGFLASPYGAGWTENRQLLEYFEESRPPASPGTT